MKKQFNHIIDYISGKEDKEFIEIKHNEMRDTLEYAAELFIDRCRLNGVSKERLTDEWYETVLQRRKNQEKINKEYELINKRYKENYERNYKNSFDYLMRSINSNKNYNINLDALLMSNQEYREREKLIEFGMNFEECENDE